MAPAMAPARIAVVAALVCRSRRPWAKRRRSGASAAAQGRGGAGCGGNGWEVVTGGVMLVEATDL